MGEAEWEFFALVEEVIGISVEGVDFVSGHEPDFSGVDPEEWAAHGEAVVCSFEDGAVAAEGDNEVDIAGVWEVLWIDGVDDVDERCVCFDDIAEGIEGGDGLRFVLVDQDENAAGHFCD